MAFFSKNFFKAFFLIESSSSTRRDEVVDVAKGIGILLVVAMHAGLPFLCCLDMPLFFFISGFFAPKTEKYSFWGGVIKKTRGLLIPAFKYIIFFSVFSFIFAPLPESKIPIHSLMYWLTPQRLFIDPFLFQPYQPYAYTLWFLTALWFGFIFWLIFRSYFETWKNSNLVQKGLIISLLILLYYSCINGPSLNENQYIGCLGRVIYAFVFICFGYILYQYRNQFLSNFFFKILLIILALSAIYWKIRYWNGLPPADVRSMVFPDHYKLRSLFITCCGISFIFTVSSIIVKYRMLDCLKRIFLFCGEKSLHIMALHPLGLLFFFWTFRLIGIELPSENGWEGAIKLTSFIVALLFSVFLMFLYYLIFEIYTTWQKRSQKLE